MKKVRLTGAELQTLLEAEDPAKFLYEWAFRGLGGWDNVKGMPAWAVRINDGLWQDILEQMTEGLERDEAIGVGFWWMNRGPSGSPDIPYEEIWVLEEKVEFHADPDR